MSPSRHILYRSSLTMNPFSRLVQQQRGLARLATLQPGLVRLAVLQPGEGSAPIKITLEDSKPGETSYECLSFDRSQDDDTVEIVVGDQIQAVPKHLETGLQTFRRKDRPRTLWADLLIGSNAEERSKQASTMRMILENSDRTICWIGVDNDQSAKAFDIIREMANRWTQACVHVNMPESWARATPQQMQSLLDRLRSCPYNDLSSFNFGLWKEIYNIFASPFWTSVQCLPDIVLAKKAVVVCGRSNIPWSDFYSASKALAVFQGKFFKVPLLPNVMKGISVIHGIEIARRRKCAGESVELLPMIMSARDARPKDHREVVFSMLPIVSPSARLQYHNAPKPELPKVDYSKNAQEVFVEASKYIIQERQDLLLWWTERSPCGKRIKGLPSWAPDWSAGDGGASVLSPTSRLWEWSDSVQSKKPLKVTDDNALHLQAIPLDKVVYTSSLFHAGNSRRLALKEWQKLEPSDTPDAQTEMFWRSLMSNKVGYGETMSSYGTPSDEFGASFKSVLAEEQILEALNCSKEELGRPEVMARLDRNDPRMKELFAQAGNSGGFEEAMANSTWGRRFFRTESGRFGMTGVENYAMVDARFRGDEFEPHESGPIASQTGSPLSSRNIGDMMSDPLARAMLQGFQKFLLERDPAAADITSKWMRGELPHQQTPTKTGGIEEGDIIVACIGGFHPYIFRPRARGQRNDGGMSATETEDEANKPLHADNTYEYIGDCYLHGVMEAEPFTRQTWWGSTTFVTDESKLVDIVVV